MADFKSDEHPVPQTTVPNTWKTSQTINEGEIDDYAPGHSDNAPRPIPSGQENNRSSSEREKQSPRKVKSPIAAAAADREIALRVWMASSDRDDDVRDALGRMLGWVEELVSIGVVLRILATEYFNFITDNDLAIHYIIITICRL